MMSQGKRHLFRGGMKTAQEIAEITGIKVSTVYCRIQFGRPIEGPARRGPAPRRFEFRGRLATIREIAAETGLSQCHVGRRTDGIRFFERHELKDPNAPLPAHARKLFFGGILDSATGWARRTGINARTVMSRLDKGWPHERALTEPPHLVGRNSVKRRNRTLIRRIASTIRRERNTQIIHRIASTLRTGGQSQIFPLREGTGVGNSKTDFEGASA